MLQPFRALVVDKQDNQISIGVKQLTVNDLPDGDVLIRVHYSGINYKDSLASLPNSGVVRAYPMVPGIDLAGVVVSSSDPKFQPGDEVIATSYEIGVSHFGGFSEYAKISSEWLVPLPQGLSMKEAMIIGTAGFTAALSVQRLQENGVSAEKGPVLVTGATGGVGSFAVSILSKLGFEVEASTGKQDSHHYLEQLGASSVISRESVTNKEVKALGKQRWAAAIDPVGGEQLAAILSQIYYGGSVAVSGLTAGTKFTTTVLPFILRGINLLGIDSVFCNMETRLNIWHRLASELKPADMEFFIAKQVGLEEVPEVMPLLLKGQVKGRILVKC